VSKGGGRIISYFNDFYDIYSEPAYDFTKMSPLQKPTTEMPMAQSSTLECLVTLNFTLCRVDPPPPAPPPTGGGEIGMKGFAGAASPPQQTPPLGFPPLSPARGERGTGGERGHVIAAKYQNLAEQGKSGEMTFLQWTQ
jgi:hypothetical protein